MTRTHLITNTSATRCRQAGTSNPWFLALLLATAACGGVTQVGDGNDAGLPPLSNDAGTIDAGRGDAGADGGLDAGSDAGSDAGTEDAGVDAGTEDAGIDAGGDDAGADAGQEDGGADDAGIDAGMGGGSCVPANCDDGNPCTADTCTASGCSHPPLSGGACNDHDACTTVDVCLEGFCVGGAPVGCGAPGVCEEQGVCNPETGLCSQPLSDMGTTCDDANVATYSDACDGSGSCAGLPIFCPENTACVSYAPDGTSTCDATLFDAIVCDDGNGCTRVDACDRGLCLGSDPVTCPTPGLCEEQGSCEPATGMCSHPLKEAGTTCDDANVATYNDSCTDGSCHGVAVVCPPNTACVTYAPNGTGACTATFLDGATCDDGNGCTQADLCDQGVCVGANPITCPIPGVCKEQGICDPGTGNCSAPRILEGTTCDDQNTRTYDDACTSGGDCVGTTVTCPPNNGCRLYVPNGTATCTATDLDGQACNDSDACTADGVCDQGACVLPSPVVCDGAHVCANGDCVCPSGWTGAACDEDIDECAANPYRCGDGSICTNTAGSYTCQCYTNYTSATGMNCSTSVAAIELVFFYDASTAAKLGPDPEAKLAEIFLRSKALYDASFPGTPLTLALSAMVRLDPLPPSITKRACNTASPEQPQCTGCWINSVPSDCSNPYSTSPNEVDLDLLLGNVSYYGNTLRRSALDSYSGGMDVPVLITGDDLPSSVVGLASVGAICTSYSGAVVQLLGTTEETALVLTHELGHGLNMNHDASGAPYIMAPAVDLNSTTFSSASVSAYTAWRSELGARNCISDPGRSAWRVRTCGNGKIDPGESCDPGMEPDSCCSSTCQLKPGCQCANTEPCCQNGVPRAAGTTCRASAGECDLADTCDGQSGACFDTYKAPRTSCSNNGYCLDRKCASRDLQCSSINDGQFPSSTGCATSTECSQLDCNIFNTCDVYWFVAAEDGSSCGAGKQCSAGACVPSSQLADYSWTTGAWSECSGGLSTRAAACVDQSGTSAESSSCNASQKPLMSRSCQ